MTEDPIFKNQSLQKKAEALASAVYSVDEEDYEESLQLAESFLKLKERGWAGRVQPLADLLEKDPALLQNAEEIEDITSSLPGVSRKDIEALQDEMGRAELL